MSRHTQNRNFTAAFGDRKGCRGTLKIAILPQLLAIEPHFVRKGCRGTLKIAILPQFLAIAHFMRKVVAARSKSQFILDSSQFYLSFWRSNLVSCERVAFCSVSLALPRALKERNRKEGKRRGQESKRTREPEGKRECEDVQM